MDGWRSPVYRARLESERSLCGPQVQILSHPSPERLFFFLLELLWVMLA